VRFARLQVAFPLVKTDDRTEANAAFDEAAAKGYTAALCLLSADEFVAVATCGIALRDLLADHRTRLALRWACKQQVEPNAICHFQALKNEQRKKRQQIEKQQRRPNQRKSPALIRDSRR
jgi:hypothetical protein